MIAFRQKNGKWFIAVEPEHLRWTGSEWTRNGEAKLFPTREGAED
jgi:hypothetical protein